MSTPPRSVINGTAIVVAIIALILAGMIVSRSCSRSSTSADIAVTPCLAPDTISTPVLKSDSSTVKTKKKKPTKPKEYIERSPLDEIM